MKIIPWNPLAINGARNLIACIVIGIYILATHHRLKFNRTVLVGAISMAGVTTLYSIANKLTTAGNTIILQYTAPIWIVILMFIIFGQKPSKTALVSILIVFAGILCFFFEGLSTGKWLGDLLALLSGIFYAGVFMLNSFEEGDALSSVFFGQLACGVLLSPLVLRETVFTAPVLLSVFALGAVQVGLAYIFFTTGTKYTDPVTASIINALEPILNPILVAVFYGEMLGRPLTDQHSLSSRNSATFFIVSRIVFRSFFTFPHSSEWFAPGVRCSGIFFSSQICTICSVTAHGSPVP